MNVPATSCVKVPGAMQPSAPVTSMDSDMLRSMAEEMRFGKALFRPPLCSSAAESRFYLRPSATMTFQSVRPIVNSTTDTRQIDNLISAPYYVTRSNVELFKGP